MCFTASDFEDLITDLTESFLDTKLDPQLLHRVERAIPGTWSCTKIQVERSHMQDACLAALFYLDRFFCLVDCGRECDVIFLTENCDHDGISKYRRFINGYGSQKTTESYPKLFEMWKKWPFKSHYKSYADMQHKLRAVQEIPVFLP